MKMLFLGSASSIYIHLIFLEYNIYNMHQIKYMLLWVLYS